MLDAVVSALVRAVSRGFPSRPHSMLTYAENMENAFSEPYVVASECGWEVVTAAVPPEKTPMVALGGDAGTMLIAEHLRASRSSSTRRVRRGVERSVVCCCMLVSYSR